jgi:hypothetical protein
MTELGKLGVLEEFFAQQIWFLDVGVGRRVIGLTIKVEPTGYLAVIKAIGTGGPEVSFAGSQTLDGIRTKLSHSGGGLDLAWRQDKYRLDKNG